MAKRKHRNQADAPVLPTPEQLRRHRYEPVRPDRSERDSALREARGALRRRDGTVLDTLALRRLISHREWEAGNRLRRDFFLAGLEPHVTAMYGLRVSVSATRQWEESEIREAAHQRWRRAIKAVGRPLTAPLVAVVVEDVAPSEWAESAFGYAGRSASPAGMAALRMALHALADHYGLETEAEDRTTC